MSKRLKEYKPVKRVNAESKYALRSMKLIRPICDECITSGPGWWNDCPHDPFHRLKPVVVRSEKRTVDPATGLVVKTETEKKITHYAHVPNFAQAFLTMRINSGLGVEACLAKGYRFPEDVQPTLPSGEPDPDYDGYAPMCEYQNCAQPNPKIRARHSGLEEQRMIPESRRVGLYCTERHAKLAKQRDSETGTREIRDATRRREQLDAVPLP